MNEGASGGRSLFAIITTPSQAMFIQADWLDPTEPGVGTNRYSYSYNDPVNNHDPGGNACVPCVAVPAIEGLKWAGAAIIGAIGLGVATENMSRSGVSVSGEVLDTTATERRLGDLEEIDAPGHNAPRPELEGLSDDDLIGAIFNPEDGQRVKVKGTKILDGNGRIKEAKRRGLLGDDDFIPVEELPADEDMAPWENEADDDKDEIENEREVKKDE